ncbi:MAG: FlgD immunoglobulin-like domain containing protein [bacterium]
MYVVEAWTDSSGGQYFGIGTDILDFDVTPSTNERFHHTSFLLIDPSKLTIKIFDHLGGLVTTLIDAMLMSGSCNFTWDGTDSLGQPTDSGDYRVLLVDTCMYGDIDTGEPANIVTKEQWFYHVYNPYVDYTPGDVNDDGSVDVADCNYVIAYLFQAGPPPQPYECVGDIDATGSIDVGDLTYFVAYLFQGGSALLDGCQVWQ